ncbi:hypothetical protein FHS85_002140 [Rhodoligotrophos appendicifer]
MAIPAMASHSQGILVDVGPDDPHPPGVEFCCKKFLENDRNGIGFRSGGTAGAPDSDPPGLGVPLNDVGQDGRPQRGELFEVTEEKGLSNGNLRFQPRPFGFTGARVLEEGHVVIAA